jgi:tetratricopeptide (TPR) repeat protein
MRLKFLTVFLCAVTLTLGSATAETVSSTPPSLDDLFGKLSKAENAQSAKQLEQQIYQVWLHSGSDSVDLLMTRALESLTQDDYETAEHLLSSIVDISPQYAEGWNKRAMLYFMQDKYEQAIVDLEQTLRLEPRHFAALAGLGKIFEEFGQKRKALEVYRKALEIHPYLEGVTKEIERLSPEVEGRGI